MVNGIPLKKYPNYIIYNDGRVFSKLTNQFLNPFDKRGYKYISIYLGNNKWKHYAVHRAVAECFIPNPENLKCVNHIDCNPSNNNISNLEWVSYQGNTDHMMKLGRHRVLKGEDDPKTKVPDKTIIYIRNEYAKGRSQLDIANELGLTRRYVGLITQGKTRKNISEDIAPISHEDGRRGSRKHISKLTESDIPKIAELWNTGDYSCRQIGEMFGVEKNTIVGIVSRKTWTHVDIVIIPDTPEITLKRKQNRYNKKSP